MRLISIGLSCYFSALARADSYNTLEFYLDEKEQQIAGQSCEPFLDDSSNYSVEQVGDGLILVSVLGLTDRSASLLLECPEGSRYYSLKFSNRRKYATADTYAKIPRPESYLGISASRSEADVSSVQLKAADRSYKKLQIAAKQSYPDLAFKSKKSQSIDVAHEGDDWRAGYGFVNNELGSESNRIIRSSLGLFGMSFSDSRAQFYELNQSESSTWIRTPSPLGLGFGLQRLRGGEEKKTIDRFFSGSIARINSTALVRLIEDKGSDGAKSRSAQAKISESFFGHSVFKPSNSNSIVCTDLDICHVTEWRLRTDYSYIRASGSIEYGLLPHMIGFGGTARFSNRNNLNLQLRHNFKKKSFLNNMRWAKEDTSPESTADSSVLHLEWEDGKWTYFADESISFLDDSVHRTVLGGRFEGESLSASASIESHNLIGGRIGVLLDLRYYFDKNLKTVAALLSPAKIRVKVRSNAMNRSIGDAEITLLHGEQVLSREISSASGEVNFDEVRCCRTYTVIAKRGEFTAVGEVSLSESQLDQEVRLQIEDRRAIRISFEVIGLRPEEDSAGETTTFRNFFPELGEAVVGHEDAIYEDGSIWVPRGKALQLVINEELLPFGYLLDSIEGGKIISEQDTRAILRVLLRKKK